MQKPKRIFRGQFQSCHCSESIFSVVVLSSGWRHPQQKRHQQNWEHVREQKEQGSIHDSCWPYAWVCKFLSWIILKNNMRYMYSVHFFFRAGSQKGEFFTRSTTPPICGRREIDAYESGEPIEPFDISLRNKLCSWFDQSFSSSFNWIKNLLCFFF